MPEITLFGWFHTAIGILALVFGVYTLAKYKIIQSQSASGRLYLACTFITAVTALGIYKHGGFGVAHALAVFTLLAILIGAIAEKTDALGAISNYVQALAYSATFLAHMIPAITDGLMRLPVASPVVTNVEDPFLRGFHLAFLLAYIVGVTWQIIWLRKAKSPIDDTGIE